MDLSIRLLLCTMTLVIVPIANGFVVQHHKLLCPFINEIGTLTNISRRYKTLQMIADPIVPPEPANVVDNNGVQFEEGCIVQTCSEIRAYHVPRKGFGSFDEESKAFVALVEGGKDFTEISRFDKCLIIPKGLRGKVRRVYDMDNFDAVSPIVARFEADDALDGDYVPPVTFLMHFQTDEVEVV